MDRQKLTRVLTVVAVGFGFACTSYADQFGNPEEPALRPYRGLWRGIQAFGYNVVKGLDQGNRKFPGLGVVEMGRGVRYGTVELVTSTLKGMAGSKPEPHYTEYQKPNEIIDSDMLLRTTANTLGEGIFWAHGGSAEANLWGAAGTFTAQKVVDRSPVLSDREKELYLQEVPRYTAQGRYLGRRVPRDERTDGDVDFIKKARREHAVGAPAVVPSTPPPPPAAVVVPAPEAPDTYKPAAPANPPSDLIVEPLDTSTKR